MLRKALLVAIVAILLSGCTVTRQSLVVTTVVDGVDISYRIDGELGHDPKARNQQ